MFTYNWRSKLRTLWRVLTCTNVGPASLTIVDKNNIFPSIGIIDPQHTFEDIQKQVITFLYGSADIHTMKRISRVKIQVKKFDGVAYTTSHGSDKVICISERYIRDKSSLEALGVIAHEMCHVWQYDGKGTLPSDITEGIADLVRLELGLAPPHWKDPHEKVSPTTRWDVGYDTTAHFFRWLQSQYPNCLKQLNAHLATNTFHESWFETRTGYTIQNLWHMYVMQLNHPH